MSATVRRRPPTAVAAVFALLAWLTAGCGSDGAPGAVEEFLDGALPRGSSGTLVAARGDGMEVCRGWGESDRGRDVGADCDTVYDIGSVTKQFTAAAVVKLQAQGRLTTSDTLGEHLRGVPADKRGITVRHLLTHTSGLLDSLGGDYEPLSRAELLDEALASDLLAAPGEEYRYSNVGYSLLAAIVEEASGEDYETYLAKHLFRPAGMRLTGYVRPDWDGSEIAVEYTAAGDARGTPLDHRWAGDGPYWNLRGNGGMLSTARDMYRWHQALRGDRVLDAAAKRQLFEPRVREAPEDTYYAYGWVATAPDGSGFLWHNGGNDLSYAEVARKPDGSLFVFWATNRVRGAEGDWDFEEPDTSITEGVLERLRESP